jgi:hypothetical protein
MLQSFKKISLVLFLVFGFQTSWAFSLLGPSAFGDDAWQVPAIGYNPLPASPAGAVNPFIDALVTGPKNLGEEYRRNTPVMYYACDANFLDYFGSSGSAAVDQAFTILNNSLTNVDGYSGALTEYPLNSSYGYTPSTLNLRDLKSQTLQLMMEQLGLADPIRYTWCLHNRFQSPPTSVCPVGTFYQVIMRNFDITATPLNQILNSPYVDGTLYTYFIDEICAAPAAPPNADALEIVVDPLTFAPPVASVNEYPLQTGEFFNSLTRDDEGGLRYLLSTNNVIYETPVPGSVLLSSTVSGGVNYGPPFVLYTSNYTAFAQAALTNDPVTLSNLYPGLIITSSTPFFAYKPTTTYVAYFTNLVGAPAGSQTLVVAPVTTYSVVTTYSNTYANIVVPPGSSTNGSSVGTVYTVTVGPLSGAPAGSPFVTNTTVSFVSQNVPTGDFYINTNTCSTNLILSTLASVPVTFTNVVYSATNASGQFGAQYIVTTSTTHIYVAEAPLCGTATSGGGTTTIAPGLYQGIGHIQFVKSSYDSLLSQFFQPITNTYTMVQVNNHVSTIQTLQRVVTTPDLLLSAQDIQPGPNTVYGSEALYTRNVTFDESTIGAGLAGPGVIDPSSTIILNKVGPIRLHQGPGPASLYESGVSQIDFTWASFDASTNDPVVYPNGTSLANLANQVLIQLSPAVLPTGANGVAYPATGFTATGGPVIPPFTWSLPSGGLPPGLNLSSAGVISGTPTQSGIFDFTLQLTDVNGRTVQWNYTITIQ